MGRTFGWRSAIVLLAVAACSEDQVTAPGACPEFCVTVNVGASDTLLTAAINRDSSYVGYVPAHGATELTVAGPGSLFESRGVLRFFRFTDTIPLNAGDTATRPVVATDSFQLLLVRDRNTANIGDLKVGIYRLPPTIDSTVTYATLANYFEDSTFLAEVAVPAETESDSFTVTLPTSSFPTFRADDLNAALGLTVRSASPAFVQLGTAEGARGAVLTRYVTIDSVPGTPTHRSVSLGTLLDTYVFEPIPPVPPNALVVGGAPSARTFIRLDIPSFIVDSSSVVRATLMLVPAEPVIAAPGDTLLVLAHGLASDIGPKSPVLPALTDSAGRAGVRIVAGMTDTIKVDITEVMRAWKQDSVSARALILRVEREGGSYGQLRFWSTADATRLPVLDVTYVPPLKYEGR